MDASEFLKEVSPNDEYGVRADLKAARIEKHVINIMERYALHKIEEAEKPVCECINLQFCEGVYKSCRDCGKLHSI